MTGPDIYADAKSVALAPREGGGTMSETDLAEVLGAFNEVTARVQASHEALRREVERLQAELGRANEQIERSRRLAALGEMAAGIAHEVRNPLGSIRLYAKMLEDDLRQMPAQHTLASKIGGAVRTVDAVVRDVLEFAREERTRFEHVSVTELVERVVSEVLAADRSEVGASAPEIEVRTEGDAIDDRSRLWCDPNLAHRALGNIVANAVQAMRDRQAAGCVAAPALTIEIARRPNESTGHVVIAVGDTGPGIRPDVMERMFNPFFTTRATGTGLGLAIVHRIMEAHGGAVLVRNRRADGDVGKGVGAVVELRFPNQFEKSIVASGSSRRRGKSSVVGLVGGDMDGSSAMSAARGTSAMENAE